jgi:hypothetical protein
MVPFEQLSEKAKERDLSGVRVVYAAIERATTALQESSSRLTLPYTRPAPVIDKALPSLRRDGDGSFMRQDSSSVDVAADEPEQPFDFLQSGLTS